MTLKSLITDGKGSGNSASVDEDNYLCTTDRRLPPIGGEGRIRPFRGYMTLNGDGSTTSMIVDGSTNNQDFVISAPSDSDRYIDSINFLISDAGASLSEFGNFTPLAVGCELFYEDGLLGNVVINNELKSNFDFIRMANGNPPIGGGANAYQAANIVSTSEGYMAVLDFSNVFNLPWGVMIPKNSTLKLILRIKDAIPAVDRFDAVAYGFDRIVKDGEE